MMILHTHGGYFGAGLSILKVFGDFAPFRAWDCAVGGATLRAVVDILFVGRRCK
jgi:hypothetical protein